MKSTSVTRQQRQGGFIPMLICILLVIGIIIYLAYTQVAHGTH